MRVCVCVCVCVFCLCVWGYVYVCMLVYEDAFSHIRMVACSLEAHSSYYVNCAIIGLCFLFGLVTSLSSDQTVEPKYPSLLKLPNGTPFVPVILYLYFVLRVYDNVILYILCYLIVGGGGGDYFYPQTKHTFQVIKQFSLLLQPPQFITPTPKTININQTHPPHKVR